MSRFVLTAQLQLQAPRNVDQVVNQLRRQLGNVSVNLDIKNGRQATSEVSKINKELQGANKNANALGKNFAISVRRFAAFSIASRGVGLFTSKLSDAVEESIDFQRELVKIKQVSGATDQALSSLQKTITNLSTSLGTSSKDLLATSRILAQTGLQAAQLEVALSALAKTTLAPTFENIEKTAEGAVAILAQFGQGVGALESQLGAINAVAGQFAVESGDLISVVRRTGGVFKSAGGDLNELLGLFTSVRATTRESSESIATGLRTIFTRIQRPATIEFLRQFGVELLDLEGRFVGPFEAVRQLSGALKGLEEGDIRFVQIAEELGGFRQIGKVIPLLQQFETAERARQAAIAGAGSLEKDAVTAQEALAVQIEKTRQRFLALIRDISDTTSFQVMVKTFLGLTDAIIGIGEALKPVLPLLGAFAGLKIAKGLGTIVGGFSQALRGKNSGGPIGFATGGVVPGIGNRDTVPAMLTPGEFVIRKSSVQKIGADNLASMNAQKFSQGGAASFPSSKPYVQRGKETRTKDGGVQFDTDVHRFDEGDKFKYNIARRERINLATKENQRKIQNNPDLKDSYQQYVAAARSRQDQQRGILFEGILQSLFKTLKIARPKSKPGLGSSRLDAVMGDELIEIKSTEEQVADKVIGEKMVGAAISPISTNVDAEIQKKLKLQKLIEKKDDTIKLGSASIFEDITKIKGAKQIGKLIPKEKRVRRATGGGINGSDTVPALLTPGEFVINKQAASRIGRTNLDTMNRKGVTGFATGGAVGNIQKFAKGGGVDPTALTLLLPGVIESFFASAEKTDEQLNQMGTSAIDAGASISKFVSILTTAGLTLAALNLKLKDLPKIFSKRGFRPLERAKVSLGRGFRNAQQAKLAGNAIPKEKNIAGRFGSFLGQKGATRSVQFFGKALNFASKFIGIGGPFIGGFIAFNSVLGAGQKFQEKYNAAIKDGNVARSKELAVLKRVPAFLTIFDKIGEKIGLDGLNEFIINSFNKIGFGDSLDSILANAEAQALAGKAAKEYEENAKIQNRAMRDLTDGVKTAAEAFDSGDITKNLINTINAGSAKLRAAEADFLNEIDRFQFLGFRDVLANSLNIGTSQQEAVKIATKRFVEKQKEIFQESSKAVNDLSDATRKLTTEVILSGGSFDDVRKRVLGENTQTISPTTGVDFVKAFRNQELNIIDNIRVAQALNNSLFVLDSTVKGLNTSLSDSVDIIKGDFNQFSSSIRAFEVVAEGGSIEPEEFKKSLDSVQNVLKQFGVTDPNIQKSIRGFQDLNNISGEITNIVNDLRKANPNQNVANPEVFKQNLIRAIKQSENLDLSDDLKKAINEQLLKDIDLSRLDTDISKVVTEQLVKKLGQGLNIDSLKSLEETFSKLAEISKLVFEAEEKALQARIQSVEQQIKSNQTLEDFDIQTFTVAKRLDLLSKKLSITTGRDNITANSQQLGNSLAEAERKLLAEIEASRNPAEKRSGQEINNSIEKQKRIIGDINSITEERIQIEREAIKLAKEKLKLEKQAAEALLNRDIETFLDKQEAAAARRSLVAGSPNAGFFSETAILQAIRDIENPTDRERAARTAKDLGISPSLIDALTDNSDEIRESKDVVRSLTETQNQLAKILEREQNKIADIAQNEEQKAQQNVFESAAKIAEASKKSDEATAALIEQERKLVDQLSENQSLMKDLLNKLIEQAKERNNFTNVDSPRTMVGAVQGFAKTVENIPKIQAKKAEETSALSRPESVFNLENDKPPLTMGSVSGLKAQSSQPNKQQSKSFWEFFGFYKGGHVPLYASKGMFVPRGTDTVPAMLSPGEFVVNRKSVERGNNRQILENMNNGSDSVYNNRDPLKIDTGDLQNIAKSLSSSFDKFNETVNRLVNFKFELTIASSRIDVVLNTPQAMQQMNSLAKEEILNAVVNEIQIGHLGKLRRRNRK